MHIYVLPYPSIFQFGIKNSSIRANVCFARNVELSLSNVLFDPPTNFNTIPSDYTGIPSLDELVLTNTAELSACVVHDHSLYAENGTPSIYNCKSITLY